MPISIHTTQLDDLYRAYLLDKISDRVFSDKVDELIILGAVPQSLGPVGTLSPNGRHFAASEVVGNLNLVRVHSPPLCGVRQFGGSASRRENSVMPRSLAAGIGILALRH